LGNYGFSYFNVFIDRVQNQGFPGRYRKPKTADSRYGFFGDEINLPTRINKTQITFSVNKKDISTKPEK
jgi:hypothetical protein